MTQPPVITLIAGAVGALIGLAAPLINSATARWGDRRRIQRETAEKIMDLLAGSEPLDVLLGGAQNAVRRRLYVLSIVLDRSQARNAVEKLIDVAGQRDASENDIYPHWKSTLTEMSRVARGKR